MGKTPEITLKTLQHHCRQEADTAQLAQALTSSIQVFMQANPQGHLNIALEGDLGAGKTTFARYLIQGLGYIGKVKSPTYTLCEPYPLQIDSTAFSAHHFDLYRMKDPLEWQEAGFAEYFDLPGLCLIEWPEKAEGTLPAFDLRLELRPDADENARSITLFAYSSHGAQVLQQIIDAH